MTYVPGPSAPLISLAALLDCDGNFAIPRMQTTPGPQPQASPWRRMRTSVGCCSHSVLTKPLLDGTWEPLQHELHFWDSPQECGQIAVGHPPPSVKDPFR